MWGAIIGDFVGSIYEVQPIRTKTFPLLQTHCTITDDSVLSVAVADALLNARGYAEALQDWGNRYPNSGYGGLFRQWLGTPNPQPYGSYGNGSAMRVSPVGWLRDTESSVLKEAERSAAATHDHPEGIKGAQAVALGIWLGRQGSSKQEIKQRLHEFTGYELDRSLDQIRPGYGFDTTCPGSVPESIIAFLESSGYEDALRNAVSLGGDADTMACIAGSLAEAFYGSVSERLIETVRSRLPKDVRRIIEQFEARLEGNPPPS